MKFILLVFLLSSLAFSVPSTYASDDDFDGDSSSEDIDDELDTLDARGNTIQYEPYTKPEMKPMKVIVKPSTYSPPPKPVSYKKKKPSSLPVKISVLPPRPIGYPYEKKPSKMIKQKKKKEMIKKKLDDKMKQVKSTIDDKVNQLKVKLESKKPETEPVYKPEPILLYVRPKFKKPIKKVKKVKKPIKMPSLCGKILESIAG